MVLYFFRVFQETVFSTQTMVGPKREQVRGNILALKL